MAVLAGGTGNLIARFHGDSASYRNDLFLMPDASGQPGVDADFGNDLCASSTTTPPSAVPLPGPLLLLGAGMAELALSNRRLLPKPR